jgi:hypothetical protein
VAPRVGLSRESLVLVRKPREILVAKINLGLDIHETGKECSVTSVKVSRNTEKVSSKG